MAVAAEPPTATPPLTSPDSSASTVPHSLVDDTISDLGAVGCGTVA